MMSQQQTENELATSMGRLVIGEKHQQSTFNLLSTAGSMSPRASFFQAYQQH